MNSKLAVSFLAILVLLSAGACARGTRMAPPAGTLPAATAALGTILRASFKGRIDFGDGPQRFEGTLAAGSPGRLRVEITGPLGGVRAVIAAGEDRLLVLLPGTREYLDEAASAGVYESLLGLRLDTRALVDLIHLGGEGACPASPCVTTIPVPSENDGRQRFLIVTRDGETLTVRPSRLEGEPEGGPAGLRQLELRLAESEMTHDAKVPGDLFEPVVPAGWTRRRPDSYAPGGLLLPQ